MRRHVLVAHAVCPPRGAPPPLPCVRVCVCVPARAPQHMAAAAAAMSFNPRSVGAGGEGPVVTRVSSTLDCDDPWALMSTPLASMVTAAGDAHADFLLEEGDGVVAAVLVASDSMDRTKGAKAGEGHVMACAMRDGAVWVDWSYVRGGTPGWGDRMARGESVRVRCVAATRMVSVVWRGREYELAALPATWDMTRYRFGVLVGVSNTMRLTGASAAAGASCARAHVCCTCRARAPRRVRACVARVCPCHCRPLPRFRVCLDPNIIHACNSAAACARGLPFWNHMRGCVIQFLV